MHAIIYQVDFILSAAHDRGKITEKAVILVSQKEKESRNIAAKPPMLIDANTPSTGLQELIKKSSHDTLLLDKGSSKDFLVEMGGVEPPSESVLTGTSPGADGYLHSLVRARAVTLRDLVASSCMAGAKLCRRTFTTDRRPIPGRGTPRWNAR